MDGFIREYEQSLHPVRDELSAYESMGLIEVNRNAFQNSYAKCLILGNHYVTFIKCRDAGIIRIYNVDMQRSFLAQVFS